MVSEGSQGSPGGGGAGGSCLVSSRGRVRHRVFSKVLSHSSPVGVKGLQSRGS